MESKESQTKKLFTISLVKSFIRIFAFVAIAVFAEETYLSLAGIALSAAEILGIFEEL